jgi:hypothetical protein
MSSCLKELNSYIGKHLQICLEDPQVSLWLLFPLKCKADQQILDLIGTNLSVGRLSALF